MLSLAQLHLHQPARVLAVATSIDLIARLSALGLREQCEIIVQRRGWFGGPLQVRVGNTDFMLRRADAAQIQVVLISQEIQASAPTTTLDATEVLI